jgi:predicted amidohydrolase YtcJ
MPLRPLAQLGAFVALALGVAQYQQRLRTASAPTTTTYHCYAGVRTHVDEQPAARCFGVRDGVFASVFGADEMAALGQEAEHVVHRDGESYAIPGLWDGHGHVLQYGEFLHSVDLFGASSFEEVRRRIEEYVERNPGAGAAGQWIRGVGWDQVQLGRMPTAVSGGASKASRPRPPY